MADAKNSTGNRGSDRWVGALVVGTLVVVAVLGGVLVGLWFWWKWDIGMLALVGDASSPVVGLVSVGAIVAALMSVRLQQTELVKQERSLARQEKVLADELSAQRQRVLRESYAPVLGAIDAYLVAVEAYELKLRGEGADWDKEERKEQQAEATQLYTHLSSTSRIAALADSDASRARTILAASRRVELDPPIDNKEVMAEWGKVLACQRLQRREGMHSVIGSLHATFGTSVPDQDAHESVVKALEWVEPESENVLDLVRSIRSGNRVM